MESSFLLQKAIKLLAVRDHSVAELRSKLSKVEKDTALVTSVLDRCLEMHYLDDRRFARVFAGSLARKGKGGRFISMELGKRGVEEGIISEALQAGGDEEERAMEAAHKKLRTLTRYPLAQQKVKLIRFLQARGFSSDICYRITQSVLGSDA